MQSIQGGAGEDLGRPRGTRSEAVDQRRGTNPSGQPQRSSAVGHGHVRIAGPGGGHVHRCQHGGLAGGGVEALDAEGIAVGGLREGVGAEKDVTVADGDVGSTFGEGKRGGVQRGGLDLRELALQIGGLCRAHDPDPPPAETTCWGMNGPGRATARTVVVAAPSATSLLELCLGLTVGGTVGDGWGRCTSLLVGARIWHYYC